ncbi:hypothetical protein O3P69_016803 [Scylla paramamosain]|uniref:Uncharacterized protein n=1 Tax=Scylla paramamosain TaxID=85552 RepID=A0AAW0SZ73_SCYPA
MAPRTQFQSGVVQSLRGVGLVVGVGCGVVVWLMSQGCPKSVPRVFPKQGVSQGCHSRSPPELQNSVTVQLWKVMSAHLCVFAGTKGTSSCPMLPQVLCLNFKIPYYVLKMARCLAGGKVCLMQWQLRYGLIVVDSAGSSGRHLPGIGSVLSVVNLPLTVFCMPGNPSLHALHPLHPLCGLNGHWRDKTSPSCPLVLLQGNRGQGKGVREGSCRTKCAGGGDSCRGCEGLEREVKTAQQHTSSQNTTSPLPSQDRRSPPCLAATRAEGGAAPCRPARHTTTQLAHDNGT